MFIEGKSISYTENTPIYIEFCSVMHCKPHYHASDLEIIYCFRGQADISSGFEKVTLGSGQFFTVNCNEIHYIHSSADNLLMLININLKEVSANKEFLSHLIFVLENLDDNTRNASRLEDISEIMLAAALIYSRDSSDSSLSEVAEAITAILCSSFSYIDYINEYRPVSDSVRDIYFRLSDYIDSNYNRKVSVADFAQSNYIDKTHLSYLIRSNIHETFSSSLNYARCINAEFLLLTTNKSNDEISRLCGFSDVKYFYKSFREWYGKTPAVHRKEFEIFVSEPEIKTVFSATSMQSFIHEYFCEHNKNKVLSKCKDMLVV